MLPAEASRTHVDLIPQLLAQRRESRIPTGKSPGITHISLDNLHFPSLHRGGKQQNGVWVVVMVWLLLFAPKAV